MSATEPTGFDLDDARAFIAKATWTFAETMPWAPHEYATRHRSRAQGLEAEFEAFAFLIETDGFWRRWGRHRWRSLNVDDHFYWLHWNVVASVRERTVINRWWLGSASPGPAQLSLEVS
jgi:hypothetical protein